MARPLAARPSRMMRRIALSPPAVPPVRIAVQPVRSRPLVLGDKVDPVHPLDVEIEAPDRRPAPVPPAQDVLPRVARPVVPRRAAVVHLLRLPYHDVVGGAAP